MLQNDEFISEDKMNKKPNIGSELSITQEKTVAIESNFMLHLSRYIGETVTIFVTSGGKSGLGFTGVILSVNSYYVRLITRIGPAPACPLGNTCTCVNEKANISEVELDHSENNKWTIVDNTLGSITDIPIDKIAAFTHNTV